MLQRHPRASPGCNVMACVLSLSVAFAWVTLVGSSEVKIDWQSREAVSQTSLSYQVVGNPVLNPHTSPVAKSIFNAAHDLHADLVRYVPWFPYPVVGVAQLNPPSGLFLCGQSSDYGNVTLRCEPGEGVIESIEEIVYGLPTGYCATLAHNPKCDSASIATVVKQRCVGKAQCTIPVDPAKLNITDPCFGTKKRLSVRALCTHPQNHSNWDFTNIRPQMELFFNATDGHTRIPNFSTVPTWMYDTDVWDYPTNPNEVMWDYPRGSQRSDSTRLIAEYYGRLLSWLTRGEFTDEYGQVHRDGYKYNITHWEVYNEPMGCHALTVQEYVVQYDAIVNEIRRVADPQHRIQFVGLALSSRNIDDIEYFLNASNHEASALPLDYFSFHFYASGKSRTRVDTFEDFFPQADTFFGELKQIMHVRDTVAPHVKADVDEMGVILAHDNDAGAAIPPDVYYNAAAAVFAYTFGNCIQYGLDVLGESQLAGVPIVPEWDILEAQYPSVSMSNWTTGAGNARYWTLKLLLDQFQPGDELFETQSSDSGVYGQAFASPRKSTKKLLLVNKTKDTRTVMLSTAILPSFLDATVSTVDEATHCGPPRTTVLLSNQLSLAPFAVSVVTFSQSSS